ncbi:sensor histidine kinase [Kosmotoga arenicorallina]|uniref:sensor histidine kinase n=1 Tax=Kosmotoga arenicorallina TaxID=688066 RepID=UPI00082A04F5|nr:HAMP domain-containing sensor histidine kinase [Kosmotoga arenicorallina]
MKVIALAVVIWLCLSIAIDAFVGTLVIAVVFAVLYCVKIKRHDNDAAKLLNAINAGKSPESIEKALKDIFVAHKNVLQRIAQERDFYRERYENFVDLVNSFELPIVLVDREGNIRFYNRAFQTFFNVGKTIGNERIFDILRRNGLKIPIKKGNYRVFSRRQNRRFMVVVEGSENDEFSMIFTDITARWKTERLLEKTMRYAVSAETVADLAHGLKQPLANLQLAFDLYQKTGKEQNLRRLEQELKSLKEKIFGVLQIYHYGEEPQNVDLPKILNRVIRYLEPIAENKGINLRVSSNVPKAVVTVQERRLENVIKNLVINALEAIPEANGNVVLKLKKGREWITLLIGDNGVGMGEEVLKKAAKAFFTTKESGTGLGLTLAKSFCEDNDVTLKIRSKEGKGTTVRLTFKR